MFEGHSLARQKHAKNLRGHLFKLTTLRVKKTPFLPDTIASLGFNSCHYYFVNLFPTPSSAEFQVRRAVKLAPLTGINAHQKMIVKHQDQCGLQAENA